MDIDADLCSDPGAMQAGGSYFILTIMNKESKAYSDDCICIGDQDEVGWWTPCQLPIQGNLLLMKNCFRWNDWSRVASRIFKDVNDLEDKCGQ